jgi:hypothetical protein
MKTKDMKYLTSKKFIIDFLESIEQPLTASQIENIMEGTKYLDKLLREQELKINQQIAINQMLAEEF